MQKTVKEVVRIQGVGLHSGRQTEMLIKPAQPNQGILFVRTDLPEQPEIYGHFSKVMCTRLATTLGSGRHSVATVEHIMAALHGCGIDNAVVEVGGAEIPVMDGSSHGFCRAIAKVGTVTQLKPRVTAILKKRIEVKVDDKWAVAEPSKHFEIQASVEWDHPAIGYQEFYYREGKTAFKEIANARTFGFLADVENLKRMGLAQGGSLENAIVLDDARVLNPDGLRYSDEFVRHKVLDAIGDLRLAGVHLKGAFRLHRAGHDLHHRLLTAIFRDPANFELVFGDKPMDMQLAQQIPAFAVAFGR